MAGFRQLQKMVTGEDYPTRYHTAKATQTCILCGERALLFRSASSELEYRVSGLCQECQDKHFASALDSRALAPNAKASTNPPNPLKRVSAK
jgi:hypothetical protein